MKYIPIKRIFRYAIAVSIVLTIAAYSNPANATDSGSIVIEDLNVSNSYTLDTARILGGTNNLNSMKFDNTDYNYISSFHVNLSESYRASKNFSSSAFTISAGGIGGGYVWYDNLTIPGKLKLYYVFDTNAVFTSNWVNITPTTNIFTDLSLIVGNRYCSADTPSASKPIALYAGDVCGGAGKPAQSSITYEAVSMSTRTTNNYTIDYPTIGGSHGFVMNITKQTIYTKVEAYNDNGYDYFIEPSFNNNSVDYANATFTGIGLNISLASGAYTDVFINHSSSFQAPNVPNVPANNTKNGVGLVWEFNTYTIDTTGNLTWSKTTPALACDNIKIFDEVEVIRATVQNPNDNGFYKIMLDREGTWKAEYRRQTLCGLSVEEVLNTAYTNVPNPEASYLVINATTIAGRQENVTYRSGRISPFNPYLAVLNVDGIPEGKYSISGYAINLEGTSPVVINTAGLHTIRICDAFGCDPVVTTTNTVFNTSTPTENVTLSNITMDGNVYSFEDTAIITYAIDNYNFSNKAIIITSFNWDYGVEQTRFSGFSNQTGSVQELLSFFLGKYVYTGQYSMRLVGRNETGDYILAFWNFTISDLDSEGYMLKMSKNSLCLGESNTFKVLSPTTSTLNVTLNTNGNVFNSYSINMNKTISYKPSAVGTYSVILYSPEWYVKRSVTFDVVSCVTPTPTPGATQGATQAKAMASMLMSNVFWSFIITAGLMIAIAWRTRHGMAAVAIGALSMTVFASIGWFPLWAFFSVVIICATLLAANWVRQQFDIGTSGD